MLHLFKNVYLDVDENLDIGMDRVVISEKFGIPVASEVYDIISPGAVLASGTNLAAVLADSSMADLFSIINDRVDQNKKPVVIYVDKQSFLAVSATFYKTILPNAAAVDVFQLLKSYFFKEMMFSGSRMTSTPGRTSNLSVFDATAAEFDSAWNSVSPMTASPALTSITSALSVEFYLASYMFNGTKKAELKRSLRALVLKDLEKVLYELKETILVHMQRPSLQARLKTSKTYDFSNFYDLVNDPSPVVQTMFDTAIWNTTGMQHASSKGSINIAAITDAQIALLKEYVNALGQEWEEAAYHSYVRSDQAKMDFLKFFRTPELSDEALNAILNFEIENVPAAAACQSYPIDTGTVNHYFVDFVFKASRDNQLALLRPYTLK